MPGIVLGSGACKSLTEGLRNVLRDHLREMGESGLKCWDGNTKAFITGTPEQLAFQFPPRPTVDVWMHSWLLLSPAVWGHIWSIIFSLYFLKESLIWSKEIIQLYCFNVFCELWTMGEKRHVVITRPGSSRPSLQFAVVFYLIWSDHLEITIFFNNKLSVYPFFPQ